MSKTTKNVVAMQKGSCDDVLKYINRVLMEDDDFADEAPDTELVFNNSNPHFVEDYQHPKILNTLNTVINPCNDRHVISKKRIAPQFELCDTILKYINRVLMEEDDIEDKRPSIKGSKLDATERSFHEIVASSNRQYESRSKKYRADCPDESVINEMLAKIVLSYGYDDEPIIVNASPKKETEKGISKRKSMDIRTLLLQCMQSVANEHHKVTCKLLKEIRSQACAFGGGTQRMACYFADALEARATGSRALEHKALAANTLSDTNILRAFKLFLTKFPFIGTTFFFANQMIMELAEKTNSIHIINFGIMHGLQWPPLILRLSERSGGPPKLRITGIEFPQTGFHPEGRVNDTGCRLSSYCKELNVPFEYNGLAKNWETIKLEDLKIEKGEALVVHCMNHSMYLLDETIVEPNPRDAVLRFIKTLNPDIFIHAIVSGTYNSPFFVSRFREALFHYSTWFDMFDTILPRESPERMVFEREVSGREILNIVASEGLERIERPETHKQWHKRTVRAGFKPIPLNPDIVNEIKARVASCYHKDFFVDEKDTWLLNGWKGRPLFGVSCWKPGN